MADFFAVLREADEPIRRLLIRQDVQDELSRLFVRGTEQLLDEGLERIAFEAGSYKPDETEVWLLEEFELPEELQWATRNPVEVGLLRDVDDALPDISAIVASFGEELGLPPCVAFQAFDRRQYLTRRGLSLVLSGETFRRLTEPGLTIGEEVHAVYQEGSLLFRRGYWARRVVDLKPYYREATVNRRADGLQTVSG